MKVSALILWVISSMISPATALGKSAVTESACLAKLETFNQMVTRHLMRVEASKSFDDCLNEADRLSDTMNQLRPHDDCDAATPKFYESKQGQETLGRNESTELCQTFSPTYPLSQAVFHLSVYFEGMAYAKCRTKRPRPSDRSR